MKYCIGTLCCLLLSVYNYAQDTASAKKMAAGLRADGKIYVVVAIVVTILLGLTLYLISLDRKISRLEKQNL